MFSTVAAKTLKIGSISPRPYAADGNDIVNGVRTALAIIEEENGIKEFNKRYC